MDKIRYDLFSAAASMAGYIFKDLQFNEIIYNYNDNLIKFYDQKKYEIYYNSYDTLDYGFPNETTTEVFQKSPENPYLVMKVSFSLGVVDTEKTTSGTFTLYSSVYRMKKVYDDFSKMYVPKTKFEFTYKDLKVDDLSAVLIDEEFLKMIIKFFCYEQELRMAQLYNEKSAVVYYNDKQIPKQEKLVNVYGSQNKIDFTINSMEQLISKDAKVIAQQRRSGAVNGKVEEDFSIGTLKIDQLKDHNNSLGGENYFLSSDGQYVKWVQIDSSSSGSGGSGTDYSADITNLYSYIGNMQDLKSDSSLLCLSTAW